MPIDNNRVGELIRLWALGRSNWLFAGSLRSGQRAANTMSLIQSAKLNGLEPHPYLKDVLARLPRTKPVRSTSSSLSTGNWVTKSFTKGDARSLTHRLAGISVTSHDGETRGEL